MYKCEKCGEELASVVVQERLTSTIYTILCLSCRREWDKHIREEARRWLGREN